MNLFPAVDSSSTDGKENASKTASGSASFKDELTTSTSAHQKSTDKETAHMTIFYGGQVIVLDGFPSDKAMEIMDAAKSASSSISTGFIGGASSAHEQISNSKTKTNANSGGLDCNKVQEAQLQLQDEAAAGSSSSDLPIARRASLRRFLEKRKDRVSTIAPYQMNTPAGPSGPEESSHPWIDLEAQPCKHLELRL